MDPVRIEIHHGGRFETRESIYYYIGGTTENIYNVDSRSLSIEILLKFLNEIGYGDGIPCCHGCQAILSINAEPETYVNDCFKKDTYMRAYSHLMCPMKGSIEWQIAQQVKLLPPKARRMPGRPKKHRRREADEEGSGTRLSKKGIVMKCSRCLLIGHNKATCKTDESEVIKNHKKAAEAKKAQGEAAKAHSLRNKQNVRKKSQTTSQKHQSSTVGEPQTQASMSGAQPKKRGRPPKTAPQVKRVNKSSGVGVFMGDDGHTYMSGSTTTVRVTSSQSNPSSMQDERAGATMSTSVL